MKFRAIFTADWHNALFQNLGQPDSTMLTSQSKVIKQAVEEMANYAKSHEIEHLFHLGDVYHRRNYRQDAINNLVVEEFHLLEENGISSVVLVGNHDQANQSGSVNALDRLETEKTQIISEPTVVNVCGWDFLCIPYMEHRKSIEATEKLFTKVSGHFPVFLMGHLGISGAKVSGFEHRVREPVSLQELGLGKFVYGAFGHYHEPQDLSRKASYVGAPVQHSFRDKGSKRGFWVYTFIHEGSESKIEREFVHLDFAPRFYEVAVDKYDPENYRKNDFLCITEVGLEDIDKLRTDSRIIDFKRKVEEEIEEEIVVKLDQNWNDVCDQWVDYTCEDMRKKKSLKTVGREILDELEI